MAKKSLSIGCVLINENDEIAIVSKIHENGFISFSVPKGKPDGNEKPEKTAKRETWEETGIPETRMHIHDVLVRYKSYRMGNKGNPDRRRPRTVEIHGGYTDYTDELKAQDEETHPWVYWVPIEHIEREEEILFDDNEFHIENIKFYMSMIDRKKLEKILPELKKVKKREMKRLEKKKHRAA